MTLECVSGFLKRENIFTGIRPALRKGLSCKNLRALFHCRFFPSEKGSFFA
jgi:hypothetical protein